MIQAVKAKNDTIKVANSKVKATKKSQQIAWGSLIATLFCCLMAYPVVLEVVWEFISAPIILAWDSLNIYAKWMTAPYYSKFVDSTEKLYAYPPGTAWILRILSFALLITIITGICYGLYQLWLYYSPPLFTVFSSYVRLLFYFLPGNSDISPSFLESGRLNLLVETLKRVFVLGITHFLGIP